MPDPLDLSQLPALQANGYLRSRRHPALPLTIWNYTEKTQGEGYWTAETRACRGLIVDDDGVIVARPMPKFFNWNDPHAVVPLGEPFEVYEKSDGSLIIVTYREPYGLIVASRGSFMSEQARWADELLVEEHGECGPDAMWIEPDVTYCFELLHPDNRIVLDYGGRKELVLLAAYWPESGKEIPLSELDWLPFTQPRRYPPAELADLAAREEDNREGYVIRYQSGHRLKVKLASYLAAHRLVTGISEHTIWEMLAAGQLIDALYERVPDEFYAWARDVVARLTSEYEYELMRARLIVDRVRRYETRREQAEYILAHTPSPSAAFRLLDGRDPSRAIWKSLEPRSKRPYWNLRKDEESWTQPSTPCTTKP